MESIYKNRIIYEERTRNERNILKKNVYLSFHRNTSSITYLDLLFHTVQQNLSTYKVHAFIDVLEYSENKMYKLAEFQLHRL